MFSTRLRQNLFSRFVITRESASQTQAHLHKPHSSIISLSSRRPRRFVTRSATSLLIAIRHPAKLAHVVPLQLQESRRRRIPSATGSAFFRLLLLRRLLLPSATGSASFRLLLPVGAASPDASAACASAASGVSQRSRPRRLVALGVEATLDEGGRISNVVSVRFKHQTVHAQTLIL